MEEALGTGQRGVGSEKRGITNAEMAYVIADNIISPLGDTSEANYQAVKSGKSGIREYAAGSRGIPHVFTASLLSGEQSAMLDPDDSLTHFERLAMTSARKAIATAGIDASLGTAVFILSSTKGSIEQLSLAKGEAPSLAVSAKKIATRLGFTTVPIVVCNACISGSAAMILASRLLEQGEYEYAVVCGADCPDRFIISGFQSLKALSTEPCRPFDMERFGLNLGEAAATVVLGKEQKEADNWWIGKGCVRNDAFHISAPSKTAEGLYQALEVTLQDVDKTQLAFVNAHGTATLFNDQMESIAIGRAGLSDVPADALKGYFGHTLGAAGLLETIISMKATDDHTLLGTRGFEELGVSGKVNISAHNRPTDKHSFVKMLSGFGGCNATLLATKYAGNVKASQGQEPNIVQAHKASLSPAGVWIDGKQLEVDTAGADLLTYLYKQHIGNYPKYYKMDGLSRLGFVASELMLQTEGKERFTECDDRAVILFNHSSSIYSDKKYLESIKDTENYFPSPSVFVYTLPNIVTGEIAIRNGYHGETSFYILTERDETQMKRIMETAFADRKTNSILGGWIDYEDEQHYEAELIIYTKI